MDRNKKIDSWKGLATIKSVTCPFCGEIYVKNRNVVPCCDKADKFRESLKKHIWK